ncbi:MAG: DMT family transporter [Phycisphaerales bacterium]
MQVLLIALAFVLGALIPFQAGANVQIGKHLPSNVHATAMNFAIGLAVLILAAAAYKPAGVSAARLGQAPWWAWIGGLMGAAFVLGTVLLAPRLGTVLFLAATVAGQLVASLVIDHWGWMDLGVRQATPGRLAGVALVLAGVVVIKVF